MGRRGGKRQVCLLLCWPHLQEGTQEGNIAIKLSLKLTSWNPAFYGEHMEGEDFSEQNRSRRWEKCFEKAKKSYRRCPRRDVPWVAVTKSGRKVPGLLRNHTQLTVSWVMTQWKNTDSGQGSSILLVNFFYYKTKIWSFLEIWKKINHKLKNERHHYLSF